MFAQLGNIIFENTKGLSSLTKTGSAVYAEHQLLDGKPRLQKTGNSLEEMALSIRLHVSFCNPDEELSNLKKYRDEGEVLTLLFGNGKNAGTFVIVDLEETVEDADSLGNIFSYLVSMSLKEYLTSNRLQQEEIQYKNKAIAIGNKKPVSNKKDNPPTCTDSITEIIMKIGNSGARINTIVIEKGGIEPAENRFSVLNDLEAIKTLNDELILKCDDPKSCVSGNISLKYRAGQLLIADQNFKVVASNKSYLQINSNNLILQACIRLLKEVAHPIITNSILRNA